MARLSYNTTEEKLKQEFQDYGPVKSVAIAKTEDGKSRGYAFVEFEADADMKNAYKRADGRKIDGRRVLVDVERGRTVKGWLPRRLGTRAHCCHSVQHSFVLTHVCDLQEVAWAMAAKTSPSK